MLQRSVPLLRAAPRRLLPATSSASPAPAAVFLQTTRGISASRPLLFASPFDDGSSRLQETPVNIVRHVLSVAVAWATSAYEVR